MHSVPLRPLAFILAGLFVGSPAFAAELSSRITDADNKPLANLDARLINADGSQRATTQTDADGVAHFSDVPAGQYTVTATRPDGSITDSGPLEAVESKTPTVADVPGSAVKVVPPKQDLDAIVVTAAKLKEARVELSPKVGTTVYTIDKKLISSLGQGDATAFDDVLEHLPGVDKDSKASGSLHVRDDHGDVQYRLDGVQLPESIAGFGSSIDSRFVDQIDFLTGALPAQYGLHTAGVVDIQTKEGAAKPGGTASLLVGSHDTVSPSAALFGTAGALSYYFAADTTSNDLGIENPRPTDSAAHDRTTQTKSFGDLSYFIDDTTRIGLIFGTYDGKFQIPTNPGQSASFSLAGYSNLATGINSYPSSSVNENQTETNRFELVSLQKTIGNLDFQLSAFHQYSNLHFTPDPIGDLIYNGVASDTLRSNTSNGLQADASYHLNATHTIRFGTAYTRQTTESDNTVAVFPTISGMQSSSQPQSIIDDSGRLGQLTSYYLQDEWKIDSKLTVNYGMRYDHVDAFTDEDQWSPRINAAYKITADTALHAGYSRYFTPPPQELASQRSIDLYANTTNAAEVAVSDNVKAERTNYYDVGLSHRISPTVSVAIDSYYKQIHDLIDEGQFGQALIQSPFNYAQGYAKGLELSGTYNDTHWNAYLNFAYQKAQGKDIISSQSLFGAAELAYIATHYIYLDHDQTYTLSGGLGYRFGEYNLSADAIFGSGLRRTPEGGAPNSATLPQYTVFNTSLTHTWKGTPLGEIEGRFAVLNIFDESYLLRDGSGVGVGAPQYGARRTFYTGITTTF